MVARIELGVLGVLGVLEQGVEQEAERVYFVEELFLLAWQKGNIPCQLTILRAGAEAIDYLLPSGEYKGRDPADDPDLIVLDLKMPKMDGLKLLKVPRDKRSRPGEWLIFRPYNAADAADRARKMCLSPSVLSCDSGRPVNAYAAGRARSTRPRLVACADRALHLIQSGGRDPRRVSQWGL